MSIRIGSARHDENGKLTGGRPGDQTGTEVSMQNFYVHKKGWYVYIPQTEGLVTKRYKYMRYFVNNQSHTPIYEELFDIKKDPYEKKNLIKNKADLAGRMRTRVDNLIKVIK